MAGAPEVSGPGGRVNRHLDGAGPILGRDSSTNAIFRTRIHTHGEGGLVAVGVAIHHQGQIQNVKAFALHGKANQPPGLGGHEVDLFRGGELGPADQIPFVFAIFVVDNDYRFTITNRRKGVSNWIKGNGFALLARRLIAQKGQREAHRAHGP